MIDTEPKSFIEIDQARRFSARRLREIKEITVITTSSEHRHGGSLAVIIPYTMFLRIQADLVRVQEFIDSMAWENKL